MKSLILRGRVEYGMSPTKWILQKNAENCTQSHFKQRIPAVSRLKRSIKVSPSLLIILITEYTYNDYHLLGDDAVWLL
jgi:hypothetical protein